MAQRKTFGDLTARLREHASEPPVEAKDASPHLRTLHDQVEAIGRGDFAAVLAQAVDDVTLEIFAPQEFPFVRSAKGAGAFQRAIEHNFAMVDEQRPTVQDLFAEGDRIVLFGRETGVLRSTGARYEVEFVERFTFRDGRLAAVQIIVAHRAPVGD